MTYLAARCCLGLMGRIRAGVAVVASGGLFFFSLMLITSFSS